MGKSKRFRREIMLEENGNKILLESITETARRLRIAHGTVLKIIRLRGGEVGDGRKISFVEDTKH